MAAISVNSCITGPEAVTIENISTAADCDRNKDRMEVRFPKTCQKQACCCLGDVELSSFSLFLQLLNILQKYRNNVCEYLKWLTLFFKDSKPTSSSELKDFQTHWMNSKRPFSVSGKKKNVLQI